MNTPRILIVYGTSYGQTARIANRLHRLLFERGFDVTLLDGGALPADFCPVDYDGVLVGASMIMRGYQKPIATFVRRHAAVLNARPSAFFAVSGAAGSKNPLERAEAHRLVDAFCRKAGWHPVLAVSLAGAIAYTRYNILLRWAMQRISRKEGGSTDTSRDHEYTDWHQVEQLAAEFAERVDEAMVRARGEPPHVAADTPERELSHA